MKSQGNIVQLKAKARELRVNGYGKRKNASHALNEENDEEEEEVRDRAAGFRVGGLKKNA